MRVSGRSTRNVAGKPGNRRERRATLLREPNCLPGSDRDVWTRALMRKASQPIPRAGSRVAASPQPSPAPAWYPRERTSCLEVAGRFPYE